MIIDDYFQYKTFLDPFPQLIYNLEKAHIIVDEMISNGHIIETSGKKVLAPIQYMDKVCQ